MGQGPEGRAGVGPAQGPGDHHSLCPQNIHVCLGGLFVPEAYITATRQYVAQANSWSLEELCLEVTVTTSHNATLDACSFGVTGECRPLAHTQEGPLLVPRRVALWPSCCPQQGPCPLPTGLKLQGATCNNNKLSLSQAISTALPLTQLRWAKQTSAERKANVVSGHLHGGLGRKPPGP